MPTNSSIKRANYCIHTIMYLLAAMFITFDLSSAVSTKLVTMSSRPKVIEWKVRVEVCGWRRRGMAQSSRCLLKSASLNR